MGAQFDETVETPGIHDSGASWAQGDDRRRFGRTLYEVPTKALNQAVKRNEDRFPHDFVFRLTAKERLEVVTNCDHLARLKFSSTLPMAFTEHGAIMAATVLNSPRAVSMSVFVVRAFIQMHEQIAANRTILKRLA